MKIWMLEGLDGTGKTTLARMLSKALDAKVHRIADLGERFHHNDWRDDFVAASALALADTSHIILDRSILSGLAYTFDGSHADALSLWERWLGIFPSETELELIHLVASEEARVARDPEHAHITPLHGFDTLIFDAAMVANRRVCYHMFDTTVALPHRLTEMLTGKKLPKPALTLKFDSSVTEALKNATANDTLPADAFAGVKVVPTPQPVVSTPYVDERPQRFCMLHFVEWSGGTWLMLRFTGHRGDNDGVFGKALSMLKISLDAEGWDARGLHGLWVFPPRAVYKDRKRTADIVERAFRPFYNLDVAIGEGYAPDVNLSLSPTQRRALRLEETAR